MTADTTVAQRAAVDDGTLALSVELRAGHGALEIGYRVAGRGAVALLVFDVPRVLGADGALKVDRGTACVSFEEPHTLVVKRGIARLPRLRSVESAREPYARLLEPEHGLDGRVLLELPVAEASPYYPAGEGTAFRKAEARRLRFEVTYVALANGLAARAVADVPGAFELDRGGETGPRRPTVTLPVVLDLRAPVAVRRRTDPFEPA